MTSTGSRRVDLRRDAHGLRFVEVVVNGPKTWSLAAALHPEIAHAYDAAQDRAAQEIIGWLADHATTRVGPRGRQVQVPVERLEAAVVRHYTSRAGDPHRHLHLQVNARVFAAGGWRGLHSVGVVDSIEAINGIGHAAVACDPGFRQVLAALGYTLDTRSGEIVQLAPYRGAFSARAAQVTRNLDRLEATWRTDHPGVEPGPKLRRGWDRRAWAQARPDKVVPQNGTDLNRRWVDGAQELGFTPPSRRPLLTAARPRPRLHVQAGRTPIGGLDRDAAADLVLCRLGARRSSWNSADIRGEVERIIAGVGVVATAQVRGELAEDLATRAVDRCVPLLARVDVPDHVRSLTSHRVLQVEADLTTRLASRADRYGRPVTLDGPHLQHLDPAQRSVVGAAASLTSLIVIEGAAGAGKTATLAAARAEIERYEGRLVVVTPTLKAAQVAREQVGADAFSAAWLIHQHGHRWDEDGHRTRVPAHPDARARLRPGDLLLVDEAGMLDQDTALALLTIADEARARIGVRRGPPPASRRRPRRGPRPRRAVVPTRRDSHSRHRPPIQRSRLRRADPAHADR